MCSSDLLGVRFCASSMIRYLLLKVRPRMKDIDFTRMHDFSLCSINNVNTESSLMDRMFGCGTLTLLTAAEDPLTLHDVPSVEKVHTVIADLIFDGETEIE